MDLKKPNLDSPQTPFLAGKAFARNGAYAELDLQCKGRPAQNQFKQMKDLAQLRQQLAYRPFRPFWIETVGGTRIRVTRPEWFVEVPGQLGKFIVFNEELVTISNYSDLTDLIQVESPTQPST